MTKKCLNRHTYRKEKDKKCMDPDLMKFDYVAKCFASITLLPLKPAVRRYSCVHQNM